MNHDTAQRVEGLGKQAAPDAEVVILASETVIAAMTLEVRCEPVGGFALNGKTEPAEVYLSSHRDSWLTPLVSIGCPHRIWAFF